MRFERVIGAGGLRHRAPVRAARTMSPVAVLVCAFLYCVLFCLVHPSTVIS
jgi:hypothetical protein